MNIQNLSMANIGGREILNPTPGSTVTITIDPSIQNTIARWTTAQATTINISGTPVDGQELTVIVTNDGLLGRLLTFGTGFLPAGTLLGTLSKKSVVNFIADGGMFIERSRTTAL